jgi:hypothetical protein
VLAQLDAARSGDFVPLALLLALVAGVWFFARTWKRRRKRPAATAAAACAAPAATRAPSPAPVADPEQTRLVTADMKLRSDQQLQHLLAFESHDFRPDALELARQELRRRGQPVFSPEAYWEHYMPSGRSPEGFCLQCYRQTTDATAFGLLEDLGFAPHRVRLWGRQDVCGTCGSFVQTKSVFVALLLPVAHLGRYRVLRAPLSKQSVLTRRLREW